LAPAIAADLALDELAAARRLEVKAALAMLTALGRALVLGICLAEFLEGESRSGRERGRQADRCIAKHLRLNGGSGETIGASTLLRR
jgi:hypothetical protein